MPRRVHVLVSGRVQGVWFRASARERARELGLSGYVRNLPDGRVEIEAEGPPERIEELLDWCAQGPEAARVEAVEVTERDPAGETTGFRITR